MFCYSMLTMGHVCVQTMVDYAGRKPFHSFEWHHHVLDLSGSSTEGSFIDKRALPSLLYRVKTFLSSLIDS